MKKLLMMLVLFSFAFSTCSLEFEPGSDAEIASTQAMSLTAIALSLTIALTALAYMAAKMTNSAALLLFSKDSLTQLLITGVLIVSIFSIMEGTCQFTQLFLGTTSDPLTFSMNYASGLQSEGRMILTSLYKNSISQKFQGAAILGFFAPLVGGETSFTAAYHNAFSRQMEILIDMVNIGYVSAAVQFYLVQMIRNFVFPVLVPFGLFLRAIPFMREAGNVTLAIGFTLLVIFPFAYGVNATWGMSPLGDICDDDTELVLGSCNSTTGWGTIASYLFQTVFLPNLALVVTITGAGAMVKAMKVLP